VELGLGETVEAAEDPTAVGEEAEPSDGEDEQAESRAAPTAATARRAARREDFTRRR
jgi:hypothetical protein